MLLQTKYDEAECKILKLKEMLLKAEGNEKQIRDLQQRLTETELHLNEAHRRAEEMIVSPFYLNIYVFHNQDFKIILKDNCRTSRFGSQ